MKKKKKWTNRDIPYCHDPENKVLVRRRDRPVWRKKRGMVKEAKINGVLDANVKSGKMAGRPGVDLVALLKPYLRGLQTGYLTLQVRNRLAKSLRETGKFNFCYFEHFDLQEDYPLDSLLKVQLNVISENNIVKVSIPGGVDRVEPKNRLVTEFYFTALMVYMLEEENAFEVTDSESPLYSFDDSMHDAWSSSFLVQKGDPWMLLLKVSCLESNEMAVHPKHYGLKVIAVSQH